MKRIVKDPEDLNSLLQKTSGSLADFSSKAKSLNILSEVVRQICPDLPDSAWLVANCRDNCVVIEASSATWGQRLQFERNTIAKQLAIETQGIFDKIEIKINPFANRRPAPKPVVKKQKTMSQSSADQLNAVAENAPPGLKEKLLRLAKHANKY